MPSSDPDRVDQTSRMAMLTWYFLCTTGMLFMAGKSGGADNYFIEWMCVGAVMIGILAAWLFGRIDMAMTPKQLRLIWLGGFVVVAQIAVLPAGWNYGGGSSEYRREMAALEDMIRAAPKPVLSADMVLLVKAGKEVPWEPSIFAELASTGRWDERLITDMISSQSFSFIITTGHRGDRYYDERYTPAVAGAIHQAYPRTEEWMGHTLHLPRGE